MSEEGRNLEKNTFYNGKNSCINPLKSVFRKKKSVLTICCFLTYFFLILLHI